MRTRDVLRIPPWPVAVALLLLAGAQAVAAVRLPEPLEGVALRATKEGYVFVLEGRSLAVTFQLRNEGTRALEVTGIGQPLPGLEPLDVVVAGEPVGYREVGGGSDPLPPFVLGPGQTVVTTLTYSVTRCADVPYDPRPVPVRGPDGTVRVPLPLLPDDGPEAAPDDLVEWQAVLVRELCGPA